MKPTPIVLLLALALALPAHAQHAQHAGHASAPAPATAQQHQHGHEEHGQQEQQEQHGHDHSQQAKPPAGTVNASPFPEPTAEERAAAFPDLGGMDMSTHMQEDPLLASLRVDQLETSRDDTVGVALRATWGGSYDRLLLRGEAEKPRDGRGHGHGELLWSHATGPWWDRLVGVRSDFGEGPSRQWLALGVAGLAPYKFEIEATAYIGHSGRAAARVEAEYEILLTNRWILQPQLEANVYSRADVENALARGLSDAGFGLRLRHEFSPQFAPYVGYAWSRKFGATADLADKAGEPSSEHGWVAGLRFWF
jgi:copper resistance protein B